MYVCVYCIRGRLAEQGEGASFDDDGKEKKLKSSNSSSTEPNGSTPAGGEADAQGGATAAPFGRVDSSSLTLEATASTLKVTARIGQAQGQGHTVSRGVVVIVIVLVLLLQCFGLSRWLREPAPVIIYSCSMLCLFWLCMMQCSSTLPFWRGGESFLAVAKTRKTLFLHRGDCSGTCAFGLSSLLFVKELGCVR